MNEEEKLNLTKDEIKKIKNLRIFNSPINSIFYIYFDGVKKEIKINDSKIEKEINVLINQYKKIEFKLKSALKINNEEIINKLLINKKEKFDYINKKIETINKNSLENLIEIDYKIVEPKFAVDLAILVNIDSEIKIPLIERKYTPKGFAFPGGFIEEGDEPFETSLREANEEVNFDSTNIKKNQFSEPIFYDGSDKRKNFLSENGIRDPRSEGLGKVSTYFYTVKLTKEQSEEVIKNLKAGDDALKVKLYSFSEIMEILENKSFAQGHGELLIKTIMSVPEFLVKINQKKYNFENKELVGMLEKYKMSEENSSLKIDVNDKCYVPSM